MTVPKNIAEKAQEWERLCERMEVLGAELRAFFIPHMDSCYDLDFFYAKDAEGDPQGDGEFCDQGGNPDEGKKMEWISCKDHLPKGRHESVPCIVTLVENKPGFGDEYGPTEVRCAVPAEYDPVQKLWDLLGADGYSSHPPVNALLGEEDMVDEDGEDIDWACYVSHWMPYPEPAKED